MNLITTKYKGVVDQKDLIKIDETKATLYTNIHKLKNNKTLKIFSIKLLMQNYPYKKPTITFSDNKIDRPLLNRLEGKYNEILTKVYNNIDVSESINQKKQSKLSGKTMANNVLDKQAERMMNDSRMLKDDLNALHRTSQLKQSLAKKNTKENRNALKLHTKVQNKKEEKMFVEDAEEEQIDLDKS